MKTSREVERKQSSEKKKKNKEKAAFLEVGTAASSSCGLKGGSSSSSNRATTQLLDQESRRNRDVSQIKKEQWFPQFNWEPPDSRSSTSRWFRPSVPDKLTVTEWKYPQALFMGLMWYWSQLRWLNSPFVALVEEETSWIELALDFQLATHLPLQVVAASGDADSSENSMERRGRVMAAASAAVAKLTKTVLWPKTGLEQKVKSKSLVLLGFTKTFGISGRPIFMCHEALMETLFRARLAADCSEHFRSTGEPTFRVVPVFPADGSPIWNSNSHITLADSQDKRLTQHTKEIVDQIGKQRKFQKVVPISQSSRQVEWSTEEPSLIDRLSRR